MDNSKNTPFAILAVFIFFFVLAFIISSLLFGSDLFESKSEKCESYAFDRARETLETKLSVLKDKKSPTKSDLEIIDQYERVLGNSAVLKEDSDSYYNRCMSR